MEAKMHTGTEVAVELLHIVALPIFGVERTEVRVCDLHVVEVEIFQEGISVQMIELRDDGGMLFGMLPIPLCVGQEYSPSMRCGLRGRLPISSRSVVA